jgi:hypothetical protein
MYVGASDNIAQGETAGAANEAEKLGESLAKELIAKAVKG